MFPLTVHSGGRYLIDSNSNPFLIHGDTPWSLEVQLTQSQVDRYLDDRKAKGFNTVLFQCMEHKFSSQSPAYQNVNGDNPFSSTTDFTTTINAYWNNVDYIVSGCYTRNMLCMINPAYLGFGGGTEGWNSEVTSNTAAHLYSYGQFLGNRYNFGNVIWCLGGDYAGTVAERDKQYNIASGILNIRPNDILTGHPQRTEDTHSKWINYSGFKLNSIYTDGTEYTYASGAYSKGGPYPFFLVEGRYDGENGGDATTCYRQAYATILGGGCGSLFGNRPVWGFGEPVANGGSGTQVTLDNSLNTPTTLKMSYVPALFNGFRWEKLVPKNDASFITSALGTGTSRVIGALSNDGTFGMVWTPSVNFTVDMTKLTTKSVRQRWFNPSNGTYSSAGPVLNNVGTWTFTTPGERILILDQENSVKLSSYSLSGIYNHLFRTSSLSKPSTVAIALCTNPPTRTSYNELANTGGYVRYTNASGDVFWSHQSAGSGQNISQVQFAQATADWGYVSGIVLIDSSTYGAGNILMYGVLSSPKNVKNGQNFTLNASNLTVFLD